MSRDLYWILDDAGDPIPVPDAIQWARWFKLNNRHVADETVGPIRISTIFLGLNHQFFGGPPILFETMTFCSDDGYESQQFRYSTREEALVGHKRVVAEVRATLKLTDELWGAQRDSNPQPRD